MFEFFFPYNGAVS